MRNAFVGFLALIATLTAIAAGVAFTVQNSLRTTSLSFDAGVVAWKLNQPVELRVLMFAYFVAGVVFGAFLMWIRVQILSSRVRQLEQQLQFQSAGASTTRKSTDSW